MVKHNPPRLTYAHQYPYTANEILVKATYTFPAETVSTKDIDYWREQIESLNQRYLKRPAVVEQPVDVHVGMRGDTHSYAGRYGALQSSMHTGSSTGTFSIRSSNGQEIRSVDDWLLYAPPKRGILHWKDGRSAKELAKSWLVTGSPNMPDDLVTLLTSNPATAGFAIEAAIPEMTTQLDHFGGEPRNHDLILLGHAREQRVLIAVEAKADESFGKPIHEELESAKPNSKVPDRIGLLSLSIFGRPIDGDLGYLRYQLLHGLAGTLIEAKKQQADIAVFVVHEFICSETRPANIARNKADFTEFIRSFAGLSRVPVEAGKLISGIRVPGGPYVPSDRLVFIGKVVTNLGW